MFTVIPARGKAAFGQSERRLIEWRDREPNPELSVDGEKSEPVDGLPVVYIHMSPPGHDFHG
jgi:hypothetical protein